MPKPLQTARTLWPWKDAASWAGAVTLFTLILNTLGGEITMGSVINPIGFGVMTFFALGGVVSLARADTGESTIMKHDGNTAREWAIHHPLWFALPPALGAGLILFALRLVALASGAEGPWSTVTDSALDMVFRGAAVFAIIAATGFVTQRSNG